MEIEERIISEIEKSFDEIEGKDEKELMIIVNKLFIYKSVKLTEDKEFLLKDAVNQIENKLFDIIK